MGKMRHKLRPGAQSTIDDSVIVQLLTQDIPDDNSQITDEESDAEEQNDIDMTPPDIGRLLRDVGASPVRSDHAISDDDCDSIANLETGSSHEELVHHNYSRNTVGNNADPKVGRKLRHPVRPEHTISDEDSDPASNDISESEDTSTSSDEEVHPNPKTKTRKNKSDLKNERKWSRKRKPSNIPNYAEDLESFGDKFIACDSATDVFLTFLDENIIESVIFQSNLYLTQRGKKCTITKKEFLSFLAINMLMVYHTLPSWKDYWKCDPDCHVDIVAQAMSRDRFGEILSGIHLNDNSLLRKDNKDRLYKLRPFIEAINEKFQTHFSPQQQLSIDESMILFKGRSTLTQFNPMKPIKRGYKLWCLSDMTGYIYKFQIYQGKQEETSDLQSTYGLGGRVVLDLSQEILGKGHCLYFDNYFTSVELVEKLKEEKTGACGTIRSNRKHLPPLKPDKELERGEFDCQISDTGISIFKWKDNKSVYILSNMHGNETTTVTRTKKDGRSIEVPCPTAISDYNAYMGGVDKADMLRSIYGLNRKSRKWWHRLFWGMIDMTVVNAYVVYCNLFQKLPLLDFRRLVVQGLFTMGQKSQRRSSEGNSSQKKNLKRRKSEFSVPKDVRLSNLGAHWPIFIPRRGRCEVCARKNIESRPFSKCSACNCSFA